MLTPYLNLGVAADADDERIRKRYLALVKKHAANKQTAGTAAILQSYERIQDERRRVRNAMFGAADYADAQQGLTALFDAAVEGPRHITLMQVVQAVEANHD